MFLPKFYKLGRAHFFVLVILVVFLVIITLFASFLYFSRQQSVDNRKNIANQQPVVANTTPPPSPTPTIEWKNIRVPEPNETPTDRETAVPKYTYGTNFGGKIRFFEISANRDAFTPPQVVVYQGDIVRIYLTSVDKTYDMTVPSYGNSMKAPQGESKLLEFQAVIPGQFSLFCRLCSPGKTRFEPRGPEGLLLVKPAT